MPTIATHNAVSVLSTSIAGYPSHSGQTHQRRESPQSAGSDSRIVYLTRRNGLPHGQTKADHKIGHEHAEENSFAQTVCVQHQPDQQNDPNDISRRRPSVVRPVILPVHNVTEGNPGKVRACQKSHHAPPRRATHQMAGSVRTPGHDRVRGFYLPVHCGGRFSRNAAMPSRESSVWISSSRYIFSARASPLSK